MSGINLQYVPKTKKIGGKKKEEVFVRRKRQII
jgi:hypothetical protein